MPRGVRMPVRRLRAARPAVNAVRGRSSVSRVGPCSMMWPWPRTMTRSASVRASRMSCVTMIAVRSLSTRSSVRRMAGRDGDVESREGLVQEQQLRVGGERARDRDALRLTAGQFGGSAGGELDGIHFAQPVQGDLVGSRLADALAARAERDVLEHAEMREQVGVLRERRDAAGMRRRPEPRTGGQVEQRACRRGRPVRSRGGPARRGCSSSVDLPAPLGPRTATVSPVSTRRSTSKSRSATVGREGEGHARALRLSGEALPAWWARPTTITATTISTSESATAASGSTSRCR